MPVHIEWEGDRLHVVVDGDFTSGELRRRGLKELDGKAGPFSVLLDYSGAAGLKRKPARELQETVAVFGNRADRLRRVAILAAGDLAFGLMRMAAAYAAEHQIEASVFRTRDEAVTWLDGG